MASDPAGASGSTARIAVVVPCFDDGATLEETLASISEDEPVEVVVVDDGSTDRATLAILDRLRADGVRVLHQPNAGPAAARMAGVRATGATYVAPVDADDLLVAGALGRLADELDRDPGLVAVWGDEQTFGRLESAVRNGEVLDPWLITHLNEVPLIALMRREAVVETGGWQLRSGYEDWDFWMTLAESGHRGKRVPILTSYYRLHEGRRWAANRDRHEEIYLELRRRHPRLFDGRRRNWLRSRAPLRLRLLLPFFAALPLSEFNRYRLANAAAHPLRVLRARART
jgi:glycosyltransferase involved in cell wall biosynthesis